MSYSLDPDAFVQAMDCEAKAARLPTRDAIEQVTSIVDLLQALPEDFDRARACQRCEEWDDASRRREEQRDAGKEPNHPMPKEHPRAPGAIDPSRSCAGCLFAALEETQAPVRRHGARRFVRELRLTEFSFTYFTKPDERAA